MEPDASVSFKKETRRMRVCTALCLNFILRLPHLALLHLSRAVFWQAHIRFTFANGRFVAGEREQLPLTGVWLI
jgi:hypothetical protein